MATAADSHTRNIAAVNAALEHLESTTPESVTEAMEALKQQGLFAGEPLNGLPFHEQCVPGECPPLCLSEQRFFYPICILYYIHKT